MGAAPLQTPRARALRAGTRGALAALVALASARSTHAAALVPGAVQTWAVDRGTTGVLVEDHRQPLVEIRLVFPAGEWSPWLERARHVEEAFAIQLMDPAGALRARADRLGADLSLATDARASTLTLGCRKADLDSALALARDVLGNRILDRREVSRRNRQRELEWAGSQKNPEAMMKIVVHRLLFAPGDPRRRPFEKPARIRDAPRPLLAARDTLVRLPGRFVGFGGDLTREEAERNAAGLLPPPFDLPPVALEPALPTVMPRGSRKKEELVRLPRLTQVYFALVRDGPAVNDADYPAFLLADHVLGGHFYSRLYVALRHEGGETYSPGTYRGIEPAPAAYGPWTYTRAPNAAVVEHKLRDVMRVFRERGMTEEERADAAGYLQGRRAFNFQSPGQVLDRFLWERSRGLSAGFRYQLADRAAALPLAEINAFIARFYDPALFTLVKVVPE